MNSSNKTAQNEPDVERLVDSLSSKHWDWRYMTPAECPRDLFSALAGKLTHIPKSEWAKRVEFGGTFVNGIEVTQNRSLSAPCRIEYYEPKYDYANPDKYFPTFKNEYVLYNDGELVFVYKPPGVPVFQAREQRKVFFKGQLEDHFGCAIHMPSRLDTSVSGLMPISIKPGFHDPLQRIYEKRLVSKHYLLLVAGKPSWDAQTVEAPIGRDMRHAVLRKVVGADQGKPAVTQFKHMSTGPLKLPTGEEIEVSLLKAKPVTGRTHQIRIHAAHTGFPIIGDNFYGGVPFDNLCLMSYAVRFRRPITGAPIDFKLPDEFIAPWAQGRIPKREHDE